VQVTPCYQSIPNSHDEAIENQNCENQQHVASFCKLAIKDRLTLEVVCTKYGAKSKSFAGFVEYCGRR
jgi:hypothetical protein